MNRIIHWRLRNLFRANILQRNISLSAVNNEAFKVRSDLKNANRIVIKLGSSIMTRDDFGLSLGSLASIVEQISELHNSGKQVLIVTSGAVAFGKIILDEEAIMAKSIRETVVEYGPRDKTITTRASAAIGQNGLMTMYSEMFSQYNINTSQLLVNKSDFFNKYTRETLKSTLDSLLSLKIIPILNTNDAIVNLPDKNYKMPGLININCNDSLAARLAVILQSDLLVIMTNVDGVYNRPPLEDDAHLLHTFNPEFKQEIDYGDKTGIQSKVNAAFWALEKNCSVLICNGKKQNAILDILAGKQIGTFFTKVKNEDSNFYFTGLIAKKARQAGRMLQQLTSDERSSIVREYAVKLSKNMNAILEANAQDMELAIKNNLSESLIGRLSLDEKKIQSLIAGMNQIADNKEILGRVIKCTKLTEDLILKQITVPIGVVMVIFESRPDSVPQICALSIISGNALLLKGGSEALHTNRILHRLVEEALEKYVPKETIFLLNSNENIDDLLMLDKDYIDLIIPRGSSKLVQEIQEKSKSIPVIGHLEGKCHVYIDKDADARMAIEIVRDSKFDFPTACNALSTLLIHKSLLNSDLFNSLIEMLNKEKVKISSGEQFHRTIKFAPPLAQTLHHDYSDLELTIELVNNTQEAIEYINKNGSSHTESIVTENSQTAADFLKYVDSACVFRNGSTRMSDGYRFGMGAEVGVSTGKVHARGPVGVEGLLTTKWLLFGNGETAADFTEGRRKFIHEGFELDVSEPPKKEATR